ncbi:MAG TPA: helix-turn-helix domain-containing protein [Candidatus Eisenbacteria bacterium]|nr:helix-turn-helix domain-containing protein [Candidatus Eisenbacteria bacterium]
MSQNQKAASVLGEAFLEAIREVVREEIRAALNVNQKQNELISAEELARRLGFAKTWPYEAARQGKIPFHKVGRYLRFDPTAVVTALKNK